MRFTCSARHCRQPSRNSIADGLQAFKLHVSTVRLRGDEQPGELLPAVHRVASLAKRWILGTHQGAIDHAHLHDYLNEFVFRFNRRHSRSRGMVFYRVPELAVRHAPVRYADSSFRASSSVQ